MKIAKKILIIITAIVLLSNVPPFTGLFTLMLDERHYRYSNADGSVTFSEFMSRNLGMMKNRHQACLLERPDLKDKQIYRLFTKNPLAFWRWRLYFFEERYQLPYKNFEDIKKIRDNTKITKKVLGCTIEF